MPTELEELVEFLHHGNTQIRQVACEHLVGYSSNASIFKKPQLLPITDLKLLVRDYEPIAKNAITILINLSHDDEILKHTAEDDKFVESILMKLTDIKESPAILNLLSMLLSNLAKSDAFSTRLITLKREIPKPQTIMNPNSTSKEKIKFQLTTSDRVLDQLMDCFVKGSPIKSKASQIETEPETASYDYLTYLFSDLSKHKECRDYFLNTQKYDGVVPITKLTPFTEHPSHIRRKGVASVIKNVCFEIDYHPRLLGLPNEGITIVSDKLQRIQEAEDAEDADMDVLPYILLPIAGPEDLTQTDEGSSNSNFPAPSAEQVADLLPDLQLLPPDKKRESDMNILTTHLETLLLLTTTRRGRDHLRKVGAYLVLRECHLAVDDAEVQEAAERVVQVLQRDEEDDEAVAEKEVKGGNVHEIEEPDDAEEDEDDSKMTEIF